MFKKSQEGQHSRPAAIVDLSLLGHAVLRFLQGSLDNTCCDTSSAAGDDGLLWVDPGVGKDFPKFVCREEGLGLGVEHGVKGDVDGPRHVARRKTFPWLGVPASPSTRRSCVQNLNAFCTLLIVVGG